MDARKPDPFCRSLSAVYRGGNRVQRATTSLVEAIRLGAHDSTPRALSVSRRSLRELAAELANLQRLALVSRGSRRRTSRSSLPEPAASETRGEGP